MNETDTLRYERGTLTGPELQKAVDDVLTELRRSDDLETIAASAGMTADEVRALRVEITESESGIAEILAFILVHLAGGAVSAAGGAGTAVFWKKVLLPRVRKAKRSDAIGKEHPDAEPK